MRLRRAVRICASLAACAVSWGCHTPPPAPNPWSEERLAALPLRAKIAQLIMVRVDSAAVGAKPVAGAQIRRHTAGLGIGGVLVAGGSTTAVVALLDSLGRDARLPLLVAAPIDHGLGGEIAGATEFPRSTWLRGGDARLAYRSGREAAGEARAMGIHLGFVTAPAVAPGGHRSVAPSGPGAQRGLVRFVEGLREEQMQVGIRAFKAAPPDSGAAPKLRWNRAALEPLHLEMLRAAVAAGLTAIIPDPVILPALGGDTLPLPQSAQFIGGILRRDLGFNGLIAMDLAEPGVLEPGAGEGDAAVRAVAAGADLLIVQEPGPAIDAVAAAVQANRIPVKRIDNAVRRVFAAKARAGLGAVPAAAPRRTPAPAAASVAAAAHAQAIVRIGTLPQDLGRTCRAPVLVTSPAVEVPVLSAELRARMPALLHLRTHAVPLRGPLSRISGWAGNQADCALVVETAAGGPRVVAGRGVSAPDSTTAAPAAADTLPRRIYVLALGAPGLPPTEAAAGLAASDESGGAQRAVARALVGDGPATPATGWPVARTLRRVPADSVGMDPAALAQIDAIIRDAIRDSVFPGAAVAVGRRGALVKLAGYGRAGGDGSGEVVAATSMYDIASLTKVVGTTAAIMALVDDGKIRLDAPARRYLPEFRGSGTGEVTVRHLLTHTAGLPAGKWLYGSARSPEEALRQVLRSGLQYTPGKRVVYSDFGMILLAEIAERQAGEPLDRFLARRVFAPLDMQSTMYRPPLHLRPHVIPSAATSERAYVVRGVVHDGNAFRLGGVAGHAGLFSTAEELATYAQMFLNGGSYGTTRIFTPATVRAFTTAQRTPGLRALGWDTPARRSSAGEFFSARSFGHTGFTGTSLWIDPEREIFVVLLANRTFANGSPGKILDVRQRVHNAAVRAIRDVPVTPRAGAIVRPENLPPVVKKAPPRKKSPPQRGKRRPTPRRRG